MAYKRYKKHYRRRKLRGTKQLKLLSSIKRYDPVPHNPKVVKVEYDWDVMNETTIPAESGGNMAYNTGRTWFCNHIEDPMSAATGSQLYNKTAHSIAYWKQYYDQFQVISAVCIVKITALNDLTNVNTYDSLVVQLMTRAKPPGHTLTYEPDFQKSIILPHTHTVKMRPPIPDKPQSVTLVQRYTYRTMHGTQDLPSVETFGTEPQDEDQFTLAWGNYSQQANPLGVTGIKVNFSVRIIYTIRLLEPKGQDELFAEETVPSGLDEGKTTESSSFPRFPRAWVCSAGKSYGDPIRSVSRRISVSEASDGEGGLALGEISPLCSDCCGCGCSGGDLRSTGVPEVQGE